MVPTKKNHRPKKSENPEAQAFPIVGIGFSAGGLDALKQFLTGVAPDGNAAYVVVQHLPGHEDSQLLEILETFAPIPSRLLLEGHSLEPGTIHVLRTSAELSLRKGRVHLVPPSENRGRRSLIDQFFESLARGKAVMVAGVVLSGTGTDGTVGLQKIKAAGGMCLVQEPGEAKFPDMPQSAIKSGCADFVAGAAKLAARADHYFDLRSGRHVTTDSSKGEKESILIRILCLVRARTGNDFRNYKRNSVMRRVERRMSLAELTNLADYLDYLRQNEGEVDDLARDILVSVTCFFRDPEVWRALESDIIPRIIDSKEEGDEIRVWVPGCATGEEVYSYGVLFSEAIERSAKGLRLQIYGTDIDDVSREIARRAVYPVAIAHDLPEASLRAYFEPQGGDRFAVAKSLREKVTFAKQNILSDPPFSRMDLVSCRNLLIYLDTDMQKRVVKLLHFALNDAGIAVLGSSENIAQPKNLFKPINRERRLYERVGERATYPPTRDVPMPPAKRSPLSQMQEHGIHRPSSRGIEETNRSLLMEHFDAASALVDQSLHIRYLSGKTERYLRHPEGTPSHDLSVLVNASVGQRIRNFAKQALSENAPRDFVAKLPHTEAKRAKVTLKPVRLEDGEAGLFIVFEALPEASETALAHSAIKDVEDQQASLEGQDALIHNMNRDLREARDDLRATVEDLASANEELKTSNEEVMSMNEELQSSNEELETSKEELHSLNDELTSVNKELTNKVGELESAYNDMDNLLASTDIATIFLDEKLRIKFFTSACSRLFNLIPSDKERPISDLSVKFVGDDMVALCQEVLRDLKPHEDEIQSTDGTHYLRRIVPYRTKENRIEGVAITFNDVSRLKRTETDLIESERRLRLSIENSPVTIFAQDRNLKFTYILNQPEGISEGSILGKRDRDLFPDNYRELDHLKTEVLETGKTLRRRISVSPDPEKKHYFDLTLEALEDAQGAVIGIVGAAVNITEQAEREAELKAASEAKTRFLSSMSHDIRTPLTAIMGLAEVLHEILDEDHREISDEIKQACKHLIGTLDSVLSLAHLQGGRQKLELAPVDLAELLGELRSTFDPKRTQTNVGPRVELVVETPGPLVLAEHGALLRTLSNLLGNALKFCPNKPVVLRAGQESNEAVIQVEDQGPGISEDFIEDLFKPFTREQREEDASLPGSGLGLSISHELVRLMGGSIEVDSEIGKGTTMTVRLPLAGRSEALEIESPNTAESPSKQRLRALICDDHESTCKVIRRMLRNHDAIVVSKVAELYEHLDRVDVLLLDINLQGKNRGIEILKNLRADRKHKNLHIIAFTAHALPGQREAYIEEGFDGYLGKPFTREDLVDAIYRKQVATKA